MNDKLSFSKSTIVRTLFGGFLLIIIPMIVLCTMSLGWSIKRLQEEMAGSYHSSIKMVSDTFSDNLMTLQTSASFYLVDDEIIKLSGTPANRPDLLAFSKFDARNRLQFSSCFLDADVVCVFPAQRLAVSKKNGVEHLSSYPLLDDLKTAAQSQPSWALRPSYHNPDSRCLSIMIGYVHPGQTRPIIILEISEEALKGQLSALLEKNAGVQGAFFSDSSGELIKYDPAGCLQGQPLNEDISDVSDGFGRMRVAPITMENFQCVLGVVFDEGQVLAPVIIMRQLLLGFLIIGLIFALTYLVRSYRRIYIPTQMLVSSMEALAVGDLTARVELSRQDEFGILAEHFNSMAEQLSALLKEKYLAQVKLKNAQVKFLRSQINPHFLYNSLFSLYNMIKSQDLDNAADMAIYLGQYYRLGAHLDQQKLRLSEELDNILPYLKIQGIRMAGGLDFSFEVEPGLEELCIPSLSLQSLVENAVTHAFGGSFEACAPARILISAARQGDNIRLTVEDNGCGIDPEDMRLIERRLKEPDEEGEIHALQNVYGRMRLLFGDSVSISIEHASPQGTRVSLYMPAPKEIQEEKGEDSHV